jgi:FAD/FMN-containing dehydrogenase
MRRKLTSRYVPAFEVLNAPLKSSPHSSATPALINRRTALKGLALLPLLLGSPLRLWAATTSAAGAFWRRLRPGDSAWPSDAEWRDLSDEVGGNLIKVEPLFGRTTDPGKNIHNPFFIGDQAAGTQVSGWLDAWTPSASVYAVKARRTADVVAAVNFARQHRLRLVVKGAGHSYQGTSNAPDSLLVWTRAMSRVTLHEAFVPQGCEERLAPVPAVSAEAGAVWIDLYHAVTKLGGRYVQGGGCTDVGVAGLVQSGGFGSLSKRFGTAAASLLEAEIVTADGTVRTVNACSDPSLFWALKGGGGGSWGVVTRVTLRTYDLPENFGGAGGTIKASSDQAYRKLIGRFVDFYREKLFNLHWGEHVVFSPQNTLELSMVCQGLTPAEAKGVWQPFFDWVAASKADFSFTKKPWVGATSSRGWWDLEGNEAMIRDDRPDVPNYHGWWNGDQDQVGAFIYGYESMWLPASLLDPAQRPKLIDALFASSRHKGVQLHFNKGLAGAPAEAIAATRHTATNPAVCDAFALAIIADGEASAYPGEKRPAMDVNAAHQAARAIDQAAAQLRRIAPNAGSYVSESNYFNKSWSRDFWGAHYPRLKAVKAKYDPDGLFFVHHGVGSEDWSPDGFTRLT